MEVSVYETPDLPVAEHEIDQDPPRYESEYIVSEALDQRGARETFDLSDIDAHATDFGGVKPKGWRTRTRFESRAEKIVRLQREIEELSTEDSTTDEQTRLADRLREATERAATVRHESVQSPSKVASQISLESIEKISQLESRLSNLEYRVDPTALPGFAAQIETIQAKLQLLMSSPAELEEVVSRLNRLAEQSAVLEGAETKHATSIEAIHEKLGIINESLPTLTHVVDRLRDLHQVHAEASEAKMKYDIIRQNILDRARDIEGWQIALKKVEEQIQSGGTVLRANTESVRQLRDQLVNRIEQL